MTTLQEGAQRIASQLLATINTVHATGKWPVNTLPLMREAAQALANEPQAEPAKHRQGCDALGGYGQGVGPCSCGAEQPGAVGLSDQAAMHALDMARTDSHKQGDHALHLAFARRMWAQFEAQALAAAQPVAADPEDAARLQAKIENNQWDHISDFMPVFDAAMAGKWNWFENTDCKYVELWIDMRDGGCLIKNRRRERISPAQFARQWSTAAAATQGAKT